MKLNELEIKIKIESEEEFQSVFHRCSTLFGFPVSHSRQLDEYYDTPDRQLKKQDLVVRIRTNGDKTIIALKSPRVNLPSGATSRIELEFVSAEKIENQLLQQGLRSNEASEKERWTFIWGDCEIVLDKLPFIGAFIEIEAPSEDVIQEIVEKLHLQTNSRIKKNYGELMIEKFKELNLPTDGICATFAKEKEQLSKKG